jgi:hypothetical protein
MDREEPTGRPLTGHPPTGARRGWADRRRDRIVAEVRRNRRGEYRVPTWVLAAVLVAVLAAWAALIFLS